MRRCQYRNLRCTNQGQLFYHVYHNGVTRPRPEPAPPCYAASVRLAWIRRKRDGDGRLRVLRDKGNGEYFIRTRPADYSTLRYNGMDRYGNGFLTAAHRTTWRLRCGGTQHRTAGFTGARTNDSDRMVQGGALNSASIGIQRPLFLRRRTSRFRHVGADVLLSVVGGRRWSVVFGDGPSAVRLPVNWLRAPAPAIFGRRFDRLAQPLPCRLRTS